MARRLIRRVAAEDLRKDLSGKTYIVTGSNSGVGLETTRQLITQGAHVVMAVRRPEAAQEAATGFEGLRGSYSIENVDVSDLASVRDFTERIRAQHPRLDGLVCNAGGVMFGSEAKYSKDGLEMTMAVNFFGHFLMTELLLDLLTKTKGSRWLIVSSVVHAGSPKNRPQVHLEDLAHKERSYNGFSAYADAKVAGVLYAQELAERVGAKGPFTASVHPGWARSNFGSGGNAMIRAAMALMRPFTRTMSDSNEDSAQTSLHVLLSDEALQYPGAYFSQSSVLYRDPGYRNGGWPTETPNPHARDMDVARELVRCSRDIVGL